MGYYWEGGSHSKCSYDAVWQLWMYRPMSCNRNGERQMLLYQSGIYQLNCTKVLAAAANRHTHLWNGISWWKIDLFVMLHTATYAASPCHLTPPRPATPPYPPPQHEDPIISTMTIVTMNPVEREHKFKIHACRHFMNTLYSINKGNSACPSCTRPW